MGSTPDRRLRLVVPHPDGGRVWAVDGDLPAIDVATVDGEPTSATAARTAAAMGLPAGLVDCAVDQGDVASAGDGLRQALIVAAPPHDGWSPPGGRGWTSWSGLEPTLPAGLDAIGRQAIGELSGTLEPPPQRAPWRRPGWYGEATAWIDRTLRELDWPPVDLVTLTRLWSASAILRVDAGDQRCWFKASTGAFERETTITRAIDRLGGALTPSVVAIDVGRGWMLLADLGPTEVSGAVATEQAIDGLVRLQSRLGAHRDELVDAGCVVRPIEGVPDELDRALRSTAARTMLDLDDADRRGLVAVAAEAVAAVAGWGVPDTLVHGDFHPGNVAPTADGPVVFDWSDACFSAPIVDAATWLWWFQADPDHGARVWAWFGDAWSRHLGIDPGRIDRVTASTAASAFHAVSYLDILSAIEPLRRGELADGLRHFVGELRRQASG